MSRIRKVMGGDMTFCVATLVKHFCPGDFGIGPDLDQATKQVWKVTGLVEGCRGTKCYDCWKMEVSDGKDL